MILNRRSAEGRAVRLAMAAAVSMVALFVPAVARAQGGWSEPSPIPSPPGRDYNAIAYDPIHNQTIAFGGRIGPLNATTVGNDTWLWDGHQWSQLSPTTVPPARCHNQMAFDGQNIIMFGGLGVGQDLGDTWAWDAVNLNWVLKSQAGPAARQDFAIAQDAGHQNVVLFGGLNSSSVPLLDTWIWSSATGAWTQASPVHNPGERAHFSMAYDGAHVVAFGGRKFATSLAFLGDTWLWDGSDWSQQVVSGGPVAREFHGMVYDSDNQRALLFGGMDANNVGHNDLWAWDGSTWTQLQPNPNVVVVYQMAMTYDSVDHQIVMFGGETDNAALGFLLDTWLFTNAVAKTQVTITVPAGVTFTLDVTTYTGPQLLQLDPGPHTLSTMSPQATGPGSQVVFDSWDDAGAQSHQITVGATSIEITGSFTTQYQLQTSAVLPSGGTVSPGSSYYDVGSVITVNESAFTGATFTGWSGDCAGAGVCQVTMSQPRAVTANFTAPSVQVTVVVPSGVQFTFNGSLYTGTQTLTVPAGAYALSTASPQMLAPGVRAVFVSWSDGGTQVHQILAPTTVGGTFTTQDFINVAVAPAPENTGTVAGGGWYDANSTATITATPNTGSELYYWDKGVFVYGLKPSQPSLSFTVTAPTTWVAHYGVKHTWVKLAPATSPDPRDGFAMAYCFAPPGPTHAVVFGGAGKQGKTLADTWVWDGVSSWISIATPPAATPPARSGAALAQDPLIEGLVMFGGKDAKGNALSDTWVFDCVQNQWTQMHPATVPPARSDASMNGDDLTTIMFGGRNGSSYFGDTWQWTGTDWVDLHPAQSPSPRANAAISVRELGQPFILNISEFPQVLFGGTGSVNGVDVNLSDTWVWDPNHLTWNPLPLNGTPPASPSPMAAVPLTGELLVFDANGGTWSNDGFVWVKKSPAVAPPARVGSAMAWNRNHGVGSKSNNPEILLFGGHATATGAKLNDTWVWLKPNPSLTAESATVTRFGGGVQYGLSVILQNTGNVPVTNIQIASAVLGGTPWLAATGVAVIDPGATHAINITFLLGKRPSIAGVPITATVIGTYSANGVNGIPWVGTFVVIVP